MSDNNQYRTTLSQEDFYKFMRALDQDPKPTPAALMTARRYAEKVANGSLVIEDDSEEIRAWAQRGFEAIGVSAASGAIPDPDLAEHAEDYDPDVALAQHLLHDCGVISPFVEATLPAEEVSGARAKLSSARDLDH